MINFLKSFIGCGTDKFSFTDRVNLVDLCGNIVRTDGAVVGVEGGIAIVEWPRYGISRENGNRLCRITS